MLKCQRHIFTGKLNIETSQNLVQAFSFLCLTIKHYQTVSRQIALAQSPRHIIHNEKKLKVIINLNRKSLNAKTWGQKLFLQWLMFQQSDSCLIKDQRNHLPCPVKLSAVKVTQFNLHSFQNSFCAKNPTLWEKKNSHATRCDLHNLTSKPRLIMPVQILKGPRS